jgi:hypothetical protein
MAKKRLSHDQKRKAKLAKRAKKAPAKSELAYEGNKYKTDELAPLFKETETGIYEAYVITKKQLTDYQVRLALERMVLDMRAGPLPEFEHSCEATYEHGKEADLVIWGIRHNWEHFFAEAGHPGTETLIGVLRTLLSSLDTFGTGSRNSRGYLHFVEGFLARMGVHAELASPDGDVEEEPEDDLLETGRDWLEDNDNEARQHFFQLADELIAKGEGERVANVAQQLLGESIGRPQELTRQLSELAVRAQKARPALPEEQRP